jgi:hypothetical protein
MIEGSIVGAGRNDLDMKQAPRRRLLVGVTIVRETAVEQEGVGSTEGHGRATWIKPCNYH